MEDEHLMTCQGEELLNALKSRLEKIQTANAYPISVKKVLVSHNELQINVESSSCPLIEIVQGVESYEHMPNGGMRKISDIGLRLIAKKGETDQYMERFKSAIVRCIYCDAYDKQGNDGIRLSSGVVHPRIIQTIPDYGVIEANRIYVVVFEVISNIQTWSF